MFKLLKWSVIILVLLTIGYIARFYLAMNEGDRQKVKLDAVTALETGLFKGPLADGIKADFLEKKHKFIEGLKEKLRGTVDHAVDEEQSQQQEN